MEIEWLLADALRKLGEFRLAGEIGSRLEQEAAAVGRKDLQGRAILARAGDIWVSLESVNAEEALRELLRARELLTEAGDDRYLTDVLELLGFGGWWRGQVEESWEAWSEMRRVAHAHGWASREAEAASLQSRVPFYRNDMPAAIRLLEEAHELASRGTSRLSRARVDKAVAIRIESSGLTDGRDASAVAEELLRSAAVVLDEFGDRVELNVVMVHLGDIKWRQGRPAEALAYFQQGLANVMDHAGYRPETERRVVQVQVELGEIDAAARHAEDAVAMVGHDDVFTVSSAAMALGQVREAQGNLAEAEQLLRKAVDGLDGTDFNAHEVHLAQSEFLYRRGRDVEAAQAGERALKEAQRFGPQSPIIEFVDRRLAAARERGAAR